MNKEKQYEPYSSGDELTNNGSAYNSFVAGATHLIKEQPKHKKQYEAILKQFDLAILDNIKEDILYACFDVLWSQAYEEGYRKGLAEGIAEDVPLKNLTGKDKRNG